MKGKPPIDVASTRNLNFVRKAMARADAVKSAAAKGDADKQAALDL